MRCGQLAARAALVGALAAGLLLGGCGRKGSLDAPPSASISNNQPINAPPSLGEQSNPFAVAPSEPLTPPPNASGQPQQNLEKKTFILDWLLK